MRTALLFLILAAPAMAQEVDHVSDVEGIRIVHAWAAATDGPDTLVFMEIENRRDTPVTLTGAAANGSEATLVGFDLEDGEGTWTALPGVTVDPGGRLRLEPEVLAIRLQSLDVPLEEGGDLDLDLLFEGATLPVAVAVKPEGATAHSHAGHAHE